MRKFNIFLGLIIFSLISNLTYGQITLKQEYKQADSLSYQENFDYFIKNINKSKFPTNILYDRVVNWAKLEKFNKDNPKDTSNYKHFIQAYYELYYNSG